MSMNAPLGISLQPESVLREDLRYAIGERWMELPHASTRQRGYVLLPGESIQMPAARLGAGFRLRLVAQPAVPVISSDGLDIELSLHFFDGIEETTTRLASIALLPGQRVEESTTFDLDLGAWEGRDASLSIRCDAGPAGDPTNDWVAIIAIAIGAEDQIPALIAKSQYEWRRTNEGSRFSGVYDSSLYENRDTHFGGGVAPALATAVASDPVEEFARRFSLAEIEASRVEPKPRESALSYSSRVLSHLIGPPRPDFTARLRALASRSPLRVLSLCSGTAGIEAGLLAGVSTQVELTLVDVSAELLLEASRRQAPNVEVRSIVAAVEDFAPPQGYFDVVCFVSGLHHVIELEQVLGRLSASIAPGGELWLIGEQVGRNGSRLYSDALAVASSLFSDLPASLRWNRESNRLDDALPNPDYSTSCFEGIRSADIPDAVSRWFVPVETDLRNCFAWRFVNLTYASNYDLSRDDDVRHLRRISAADAVFWTMGGRGTELNGVYRPKVLSQSGGMEHV